MFAVPRRETKAAKDALQALGMLDRATKAEQMAGGSRIALPLTPEAATQLQALAAASNPTAGAQQSRHSQTSSAHQQAEPGVTDHTETCNSISKPPSAVPGAASAVRNDSTLRADPSKTHPCNEAIYQSDMHAANANHHPTAGDAGSAAGAGLYAVNDSKGKQTDADGKDGRQEPAAHIHEAARSTLDVLLGLLRSGVAQLEWRELLASRRAGGPSPAAKLRAGMQQLLSAHGKMPCSHEFLHGSAHMAMLASLCPRRLAAAESLNGSTHMLASLRAQLVRTFRC